MTHRPPARTRKPAPALLAAPLGLAMALALSACGSSKIDSAELDDKLRRAEAAAQKAVNAQQAAESAAARIRRSENADNRGDGEDEQANYQETGPPPIANNDDADDENADPSTPAPDA